MAWKLMRLLGACLAMTAHADDIDTLRTRLIDAYLSSVSFSNAGDYLASQTEIGSWPDIDYADTTATTWNPGTHLNRLSAMAVAFHQSQSDFFRSVAMRAAIAKGIDYWFSIHPESSNGWQNIIGGPMRLRITLLLMEDQLSDAQVSECYDYCHSKDFPTAGGIKDNGYFYAGGGDAPATGQNLIWLAGIHATISALEHYHSLEDINRAFTAMSNEVYISDHEGIRPDLGFHQHGEQLYNGQYGADFIHDVAFWLQMGDGLSFGFSPEKVDLFSSLVLDGTQWMIREGTFDWACMGRAISRGATITLPDPLVTDALERLIAGDIPRKAEFLAFKNHILGLNAGAKTGSKPFWNSDYQAHRRAAYHLGIKLCSIRTLSQEAGNGENLQGRYLSQGATMISRDGREYLDIYPVWDWSRIPGATSPHKEPAPKPADFVNPANRGTTSFAGGVSNGLYGVVGYDQNWDGVRSKKAWFCFDDEIVCLGTGISGTTPEPIYTSINQCLARGDAYIEFGAGTGQVATGPVQTLENPKWVHHDQIGYVFPEAAEVRFQDTGQTGNWRDIYSSASDSIVSKNVFSIWFDHGVHPTDASYAYILTPGMKLAEMPDYAASLPVRIVANTATIQAVRHDRLGITGIVFYAPGTVSPRSGLTLASDMPALVLVDESSPPLKVSLAQPEHAEGTVRISLTGDENRIFTFHLPTGHDAGSTITLPLTTNGRD